MNISRVDKHSIDQQFTATDLIGKDVYDNAGQKVGQVKDIVLGSAAGSHLAMALGTSSSASGSSGSKDYGTADTAGTSSTHRSTGTDSGSSMASTGGTDAASRRGAGTVAGASEIAGAGSTWASQAHGALSGLTSEPAAIVSVGGFMGMGDNMVRVPLSQLNYDQSNQHLTVAISQSELTSLTETAGSQAAE
jgi:sporulation protein YlmC with PRC-barrel domain